MSYRSLTEQIEANGMREIDTVAVERQARQMRAQAMGELMRDCGTWIARQWDSLRGETRARVG